MPKKFLRYRLVSAFSALSFAFILGGIFWVYFALRNVHGSLVLHWNDMAGVTQVGGMEQVIGIGIVALSAVLVTSFVAFELDSRDRFFGAFAAAMALALSILLFIAAAAIISVN